MKADLSKYIPEASKPQPRTGPRKQLNTEFTKYERELEYLKTKATEYGCHPTRVILALIRKEMEQVK